MPDDLYRSYYESDILNATPQRLRLMLIDGAIRFAKSALEEWDEDRGAALRALGRCRSIIIELIGGIRADRESCQHVVDHICREDAPTAGQRRTEIDNLEAIGRNTMSIYLIVFRDLEAAQLNEDREKIEAVLEVLQVERETAQLVCAQLTAAPRLTAPHFPAETTSADAADILPQETAARVTAAPITYGATAAPPPTSNVAFEA